MSQNKPHLTIVIVGAGLGGLAAALALQTSGHTVTVLEAASEFVEVGAGIHLPPNSSRLLLRWGVDLRQPQTIANRLNIMRYANGETIAAFPFEEAAQTPGVASPYYLVHRADLHSGLLEAAKRAGVQVLADKRIVECDFEAPTVTSSDGQTFSADLIIGADGIKSFTRVLLTGSPDRPRDTGDAAYRILLPGDKLREDAELSALLDDPCVSVWCGPGCHVIGYPIRNGELYNVVVAGKSQNEETTDEIWVVKGDNRELLQRFSGWNSRVRKLCALPDDFMKWRLCDLPNVTTWVHPSGTACLLGDSCHPMLPYLAQGAAQAFEDAAVLSQCLALPVPLKSALERYQDTRLPRVNLIQATTRNHQHHWHLEDGEEQILRDKQMGVDRVENPAFWGFRERKDWLFDYDAEVLA